MWVIPGGDKAEAGWESKLCSTQEAEAAGRLSTSTEGTGLTLRVDQGS